MMVSMSAFLQWAGAGRPSLRQRLVRLAERVTTPLVPADYLDLFDPLRSGAALRGRIEAVRPETRDAASIVIRPGKDWLPHTPGQYVRIGIDVDGEEVLGLEDHAKGAMVEWRNGFIPSM